MGIRKFSWLFGTGNINNKFSSLKVLTVEKFDRLLSFSVFAHLHETKALGPTRMTINDHRRFNYLTRLGEQLSELIAGNIIAQITNVKFGIQIFSPPFSGGHKPSSIQEASSGNPLRLSSNLERRRLA